MLATTPTYDAAASSQARTVADRVTLRLPFWRENLCLNPNFEYGLREWDPSGATTVPTLAQSTTQVHDGHYSMSITWGTDTAGNESVSTVIDTLPGLVYNVTAWVWTPLNVRLTAGGSNSGNSGTASTWTKLTVIFTASNYTTTISLVTVGASTAGQVSYLDSVLAEQNAGAAGTYFDGDLFADINLLDNPSFENLIISEAWMPAACTPVRTRDWVGHGRYSVRLDGDGTSVGGNLRAGGGAGAMRNGMLPGRTYTFQAVAHVDADSVPSGASSGIAGIRLTYMVGASVFTSDAALSAATLANGGTETLAVTVAIPANATAAWVELRLAYASGSVYFDAAMLREASSASTRFYGGHDPRSSQFWTGALGGSTSRMYTDPYPDVTLAVDSITMAQELVSNMPAGTRVISGYPAQRATVVLSGLLDPKDERKTAAWLFNINDATSPLVGVDITDSPIFIDQGYVTTAGQELLEAFAGSVDSYVLDPVAGTVTLECIDNRNTVRQAVTLPAFAYQSDAGYTQPGLTGGWVMDYLLRSAKVYSSPPARSRCQMYASLHGAAWPEVQGYSRWQQSEYGSCASDLQIHDDAGDVQNADPRDYLGLMAEGPFGAQVVRDPSMLILLTGKGGQPSMLVGGHVYFEGWLYLRSDYDKSNGIAVSNAGWSVDNSGTSVGYTNGIGIYWDWEAGDTVGTCTAYINRPGGGSSQKAVAGATLPLDTWVHLAQYVEFTGNTTVRVTTWIDRSAPVVNNLTAVTAVTGTENPLSSSYFNVCGYADSIQITNEPNPTPYRGFYPTAYLDASDNALKATQDTTGQDPWNVVQLLAEAEAGLASFDPSRVFWFASRRNLTQQQPTRTLTTRVNVKTLQQGLAKAQLYNHVQAPVNNLRITSADNGPVWQASDVIKVPARSTWDELVNTDGEALQPMLLDAGYAYPPLTTMPPATWWRAAKGKGGSTKVTSGIQVSVYSVGPATLRILVKNTNKFDVYLVSPGAETDVPKGQAFLWIGGCAAVPAKRSVAAESLYPPDGSADDVTLQLPENVWRQDPASSQRITDDMLVEYQRPRPLIQNLAVVADPSMRVGDRVSLVDPDGLLIADDVTIASISTSSSASDWTQTIDARACWSAALWVMGVAGRSEMGQTTRV